MDLKSAIESILFISGEPVSAERLAKILKAKRPAIEEALHILESEYAARGLRIIANAGEWQLGTAPENAPVVEMLVKQEFSEELSKAALETLAVIAYKGPLTRTEIDYIRGVNSSFTVRSLMLRGLIERAENPKDARSYLYRITFEFLKYLGLTKREALPDWETFQNVSIPDENKATDESNENIQ